MSDQGSAATDSTGFSAPAADPDPGSHPADLACPGEFVEVPDIESHEPADVADLADLADERLRPVLELAFAVAVAGTRLKPAIAAPATLRRYLKFQKLPSGALTPVRRALETDQAFRERTARVATDQLVGPLGMVWLNRPADWRSQIAEMIADDDNTSTGMADQRVDRSSERRREAAEAALARARAETVGLQSELARLKNRVTDAETSAAVAVEEVVKLHAEAERLRIAGDRRRERARVAEEDRGRARGELVAAVQRIAELERLLDDALAARQVAERRAESRSAPVVTLQSRPPVEQTAPRIVPSNAAAVTTSAAAASPVNAPPADASVANAPIVNEAWLATGATLAGRLTDAAAALGLLGADLAIALRTFGTTPPAPDGPADPRPAVVRGPTPRAEEHAAFPPGDVTPLRGRRPVAAGRRQPLAIPGGLLDDSAEVAFHLIRQPGVVTIVDGYNLAKLAWPDLALADQRECCLDGVEDLVRRYGIRAHVVFDGASIVGVGSGRRLVRVTFTPSGVSADDEIRGLVRELPADQPIVVVTNDREIVRGVRAAGANVVGSEQFLAVIRR